MHSSETSNHEWPEYEGEKVFAELSQPSVLSLLEARGRVEVASRVRDLRLPYFHEPGISQLDESRMIPHLQNAKSEYRSHRSYISLIIAVISQLPSIAQRIGALAAPNTSDSMANKSV